MTLPPPPSGNPGPPPQYGGGDPFGPPQGGPSGYPGSQGGPPQHHAPQWQPPQQQQPPAWAPNPGAQSPGPPPKKRGNGWKWGLGGVALLAVIGVTAAVSISVVKGTGGGDGDKTAQPVTSGVSQSPTPSNAVIASANDTGPATIITEDPTCAAWTPIRSTVADAQSKAGWANHDYTIPATDWTPELRETYSTVSKAMNAAADQAVTLVKRTPNRVMREFYEQFIAYSRQFGGLLNNYVAMDNNVANVANNSFIAVGYVCDAITYKSAAARVPFVPDVAPPADIAKPGDPSDPKRFMTSPDDDCSQWQSLFNKFNDETKAWGDLDPNLSATEWNIEQHAIVDAVIPIMKKYADDVESLGRSSQNPTIVDFSVSSAQYWRAYVSALPSYTRSDLYLTQVASRPPAIIVQACQALGG